MFIGFFEDSVAFWLWDLAVAVLGLWVQRSAYEQGNRSGDTISGIEIGKAVWSGGASPWRKEFNAELGAYKGQYGAIFRRPPILNAATSNPTIPKPQYPYSNPLWRPYRNPI